MSHPAGEHLGVGRTPVWYGIECEGSLSGVMTAFLDAPVKGEELGELVERLSPIGDVKHLFVTENMREWAFITALETYMLNMPITVACTPAEVAEISKLPIAPRVHLMVRVDMQASWMWLLREGDQVCIGEPYMLRTWRVEDAIASTPEDYLEDKRR